MTAGPVAKVAGIFLEYFPDALERLESLTAKMVRQDNTIQMVCRSWVTFCVQLHHDQRVQEGDPFPLLPDTVDEAFTNCLLMPWKNTGRITPGSLQYLIQEAGSEPKRRSLQMVAALQDREPIVDWWQVPPLSKLFQAAEKFGLPWVGDVDKNVYVGRWEFDRKLSGKSKSTVFWAAENLL